jgi:hypothetical protein
MESYINKKYLANAGGFQKENRIIKDFGIKDAPVSQDRV